MDRLQPQVQSKLRDLISDELIKEDQLDIKCLQSLEHCSPEDQLIIVEKFSSRNLQQVHNKSAFLQTVINRHRQEIDSKRPHQRRGNEESNNDQQNTVMAELQDLYNSQIIKRGDLDNSAMSLLQKIDTTAALLALKRLKQGAHKGYRNVSASLVHLIRKEQNAQGQHRGGRNQRDQPRTSMIPSGQKGQTTHEYNQSHVQRGNSPPQHMFGSTIKPTLVQPQVVGGAPFGQALQPRPIVPVQPAALTTVNPNAGLNSWEPNQTNNPVIQAVKQAGPVVQRIAAARSVIGQPVLNTTAAGALDRRIAQVPVAQTAQLRDYGVDQQRAGVRVNEFHSLDQLARYIPPPVALKLQDEHDKGLQLVGSLYPQSWEVLLKLEAPAALQVVYDVVEYVKKGHDSVVDVNRQLQSLASQYTAVSDGNATRQPAGAVVRPYPVQYDVPLTLQAPQVAPIRSPEPATIMHTATVPILSVPQQPVPQQPVAQQPIHQQPVPQQHIPPHINAQQLPVATLQPSVGFKRQSAPMPAGSAPPQKRHHVSDFGGSGGTNRGRVGESQCPPSQDRQVLDYVDQMIARHAAHLKKQHFDDALWSKLDKLDSQTVFQVLQELERNNLSSIKNMPAYITGICKRYLSGKRQHHANHATERKS